MVGGVHGWLFGRGRAPDGDATGGWIIVDYKTDVELGSRQPEYEAQVRCYARAVSAATGEPARGVLLRV